MTNHTFRTFREWLAAVSANDLRILKHKNAKGQTCFSASGKYGLNTYAAGGFVLERKRGNLVY